MRELRRSIGVHAWLEDDSGLTLITDRELSCHKHHPLGRRVPVLGDRSLRWDPQEYVGVRLGGITVEDSQTAIRRHEGRARPPLELSVLRAARQSRLLWSRVGKTPCCGQSDCGHRYTLAQPVA
jgi:hypothetical protein